MFAALCGASKTRDIPRSESTAGSARIWRPSSEIAGICWSSNLGKTKACNRIVFVKLHLIRDVAQHRLPFGPYCLYHRRCCSNQSRRLNQRPINNFQARFHQTKVFNYRLQPVFWKFLPGMGDFFPKNLLLPDLDNDVQLEKHLDRIESNEWKVYKIWRSSLHGACFQKDDPFETFRQFFSTSSKCVWWETIREVFLERNNRHLEAYN